MAKWITESERCHDLAAIIDILPRAKNAQARAVHVNSIRRDKSDLYVSTERRSLSIDNSRGSTNGGQPMHFFVPCVPYCAHCEAMRCIVVLMMLFRDFPTHRYWLTKYVKERSATLLSHCSRLYCPASLRRILPQRFRSEMSRRCLAGEQFLRGNDVTICIS